MDPAKCKRHKCTRHMISIEGNDMCVIQKNVKKLGVLPVFLIREKQCRTLRTLDKAIRETKERQKQS